MYHHVLFLLIAHYILRSAAQSNITVDDTDTSKIIYTGQWSTSAPSPLDFGPAHHLAEGDDALANFTFTGVAVYFMSPLWPYDVFTQIQLDSQPPVELNLSDPNMRTPGATGPETVKSAVVWGSGPLSNTTHTLLISKIRRPDRPYAIVDGLIYTTLVPPTSSSSSIQSTTSSSSPTQGIASPTSASNTSSSSNHTLPIALGTVLGSLGLITIAALLWFFRKGNNRPKSKAWTIAGTSPEKESTPTPPLPPPTRPPYPSHQPTYPSSYTTTTPNPSWSDSTPLATHTHTTSTPQTQDFNPYISFLPPPIPPLQNHPYAQHQPHQTFSSHYPPTTLSTITERSTPGTLGSSRTPLASSPASFPSADLSFYTPPQDPNHTARLSQSNNGDIPLPMTTSSAAYHQHPHPHPPYMYPSGSSGHLRSQGSSSSLRGGAGAGVGVGAGAGATGGVAGGVASGSGGKSGKSGKEKNSMVAVNRTQDEEDGSGPPAYTPR